MRNVVCLLVLVSGGLLLLAGCNDTDTEAHTPSGTESEQPAEMQPAETQVAETQLVDIVDTAVAAGGFETLVAAIKAAELVDTLKGAGPFTMFAPTDDAFGQLPEGTLDDLLKTENKDKLTAILTYHVVPGKVMTADVVKLDSAKTVQGEELAITVDEGNVNVNGANVTSTDIECSNGVIHVIDAVILPPDDE